MTNSDLKTFKSVLQKEHLKVTPQRVDVFEEVCFNDKHREAEEIFLSLKRRGKKVSRATVYRTIDLLYKHRLVQRIEMGDGGRRYEHWLDCTHHDHLICVRCGKIVEFMDEEIESNQKRIAHRHQYKLVRHVLNLFGYCSDCRKLV